MSTSDNAGMADRGSTGMDRSGSVTTDAGDADPVALQRREIDTTRQDMGRTLERLEDRVSPSRMKERQADRIRGRWQGLKESVMGSDSGHGPSVGDRFGQVGDQAQAAVHDAPERLEGATRGNPLAAGLVAAGVGALIGSVIPTSGPERRVAGQLRDEFEEPVRAELQDAGREAGDQLRDHAKEAVDEVKHAAQDAVEHTKQEAADQTERIRSEGAEDHRGDGGATTNLRPGTGT